MSAPSPIVRDLIDAIGEEAVVWQPEDLLVYEYDATIDRGNPDAIALPANTEDVAALLKIANKYGVPVTPRGAGTGLSGGALAARGGIVIGMNRMRRILDLDAENRTALVQPGVVNLDLGAEANRHGLSYAPDPSSQRACTIGGNVAENAGGPHTLAWGTTTNHVLALELVTPDGEVQWIGDPQGGVGRDQPGYDLVGCVVGSEGTVGIVTQVLVRLVPMPTAVRTMLAIYDSVRQASSAVSAVVASGVVPAALEMIDKMTIAAVEPVLGTGFPLDAEAVLLVEVEGPPSQVESEGRAVESILRRFEPREVRSATDPEEREALWAGRYGLPVANMFHAGDGNLHPCLLFDEREPGATARVLDAGGEIMRACVDAGGAITGEHGVGLEKRDYLPWIFSEDDIESMQALRGAFGPTENFNPCKIFPAGHGCGEAASGHAQQTIARFGDKAYV